MNNPSDNKYVIETRDLDIFYGNFKAVTDVSMQVKRNAITAIIGPSGCGKSTLLRAFNRMNELYANTSINGEVTFNGEDIYARDVDPVEVRYRIGMVFQKPNPFPKSIYENIAWTARIHGYKGKMNELVESVLQQAALWDEVKDKLHQSGLSLSGGQQQRLCIARAISIKPDVILMDEPASALDPIATLKIEELMQELKKDYTIVIVTHNMQQAARASDYTAMMMLSGEGQRSGTVIEFDETHRIFTNPKDKRTEEYVTGRFG
ncbi:MAG TPA: phosphate ABC transporter ATP-binding protein PstB [Anaerolineales bacterium]|nr:phosphate ABC transporter ATP-binding protein PstB [Anaerolineales bacterium]